VLTLVEEGKSDLVKEMNEIIIYMKEPDADKPLHMISCWIDEIKDSGGMYWSGIFHYTDEPLIEDNVIVKLIPVANITGAIVLFHIHC